MKLYFKQQPFSFRQRTAVYDQFGNVLFNAVGEISLARKMHVYDRVGNEVAYVEKKLLHLLPRFSIYIGGQYVTDIVKEFTLFKPSYLFERIGWSVSGEFLSHDYTIKRGNMPIAYIHKQWMTWGDSFEIDIAEGQDIVMVLAAVIAIDCVMDSNNSSSSN
ncbi:LURP-one-related/scramblase family protein [uncultured Ruminococcus sp.]|uniref:LURP-one-related/scramblase family protein n=1 Tax=uncultured Ruminococcus sp. TaxID=165186 RepID=UPI00260FFF78|nr:LURP-one-related family protein [uncultured Ruminococcus sp.]